MRRKRVVPVFPDVVPQHVNVPIPGSVQSLLPIKNFIDVFTDLEEQGLPKWSDMSSRRRNAKKAKVEKIKMFRKKAEWNF